MNSIVVSGRVVERPTFLQDGYCTFKLKSRRKSGTCDTLEIIAKDCFMNALEIRDRVICYGWIYGRFSNDRLMIRVHANKIEQFEDLEEFDVNTVEIDCVTSNTIHDRITGNGIRIADFSVKCRRSDVKYDVIPCLAWNTVAKKIDGMQAGVHLKLRGRLQSRKYTKVYDDGFVEERMAYELSITVLKEIKNEENQD